MGPIAGPLSRRTPKRTKGRVGAVAATSQTQTGATGSSAFAAGQVKRQVKPEGA